MKKIFIITVSLLFCLNGLAFALPISSISDVTGSIDSEDGIKDDDNNDLTDLNNGDYWYTDWIDLQKWEQGSGLEAGGIDVGLLVSPDTQSNDGLYAFNITAWDTYSHLMIVLKDGGVSDPAGAEGVWKWFAYLLGEAEPSLPTNVVLPAGWNDTLLYTGQWTYPDGKDLSHLSIYGRIGDDPPPGDPIPEPATMLLLGTGLIGLAGVTRKRLNR